MFRGGLAYFYEMLAGVGAELWFTLTFLYPWLYIVVLFCVFSFDAKGRFLRYCKRIKGKGGYDLAFLAMYADYLKRRYCYKKIKRTLCALVKNNNNIGEALCVLIYYSAGIALCIGNGLVALCAGFGTQELLFCWLSPVTFFMAVGICVAVYVAGRSREFKMCYR